MTELKVLHHQGTDKGTICVIMFIVVIVFVYYPFYFILYKRFLTRDTELSDSILEIISILERRNIKLVTLRLLCTSIIRFILQVISHIVQQNVNFV
jgi:hypothetical protein